MADLTDADYQQAKNGDTECAKELLQRFLNNLIEAKDRFHPVIHEYAVSALEKILSGDVDATHAFLLKRKGRGNKETPQKTRKAVEIATDVHHFLKDNRGSLIGAITELKNLREKDDDPEIKSTYRLIGVGAIKKIYLKWRDGIEEDERFEG